MEEYEVLYFALDESFHLIFLIPILGILGGVGMFIFFVKVPDETINSVRRKEKLRKAAGYIVFGFSLALLVLLSLDFISNTRKKFMYENSKIIKGDVLDYKHEGNSSAGKISFSVDGINFFYYPGVSDFFESSYNNLFRSSIEKSSKNLRISYYTIQDYGGPRNIILKIEKKRFKFYCDKHGKYCHF